MANPNPPKYPTEGAPGQDKTYQITNPSTGETRTVTQREWREGKLGQQGWQKPADLPETPEDQTPGGEQGGTTGGSGV